MLQEFRFSYLFWYYYDEGSLGVPVRILINKFRLVPERNRCGLIVCLYVFLLLFSEPN